MPIPLTKISSAEEDIKLFLCSALTKLSSHNDVENFLVHHWIDGAGLHVKFINKDDSFPQVGFNGETKVKFNDALANLKERSQVNNEKSFNSWGNFSLNDALNVEQKVDEIIQSVKDAASITSFKNGVFKVVFETDEIIHKRDDALDFMKSLVEENPKISWKYIKTSVFNNDFNYWTLDVYESLNGFCNTPDPASYETPTSMLVNDLFERVCDGLSSFYSEKHIKPKMADYINCLIDNKAFSFKNANLKLVNRLCSEYHTHLKKKTIESMFANILTGDYSVDNEILVAVKKMVDGDFENKALKSLEKKSLEAEKSLFLPKEEIKELLVAFNENFFKDNLNIAYKSSSGEVKSCEIKDINKIKIYNHSLSLMKSPEIRKLSGIDDFELIHVKAGQVLCVLTTNENYNETKFQELLKDGLGFLSERSWQNPGQEVEPFSALMKSPEEREMQKSWMRMKLLDDNMIYGIDDGEFAPLDSQDNGESEKMGMFKL